jgi:hypothetical protein
MAVPVLYYMAARGTRRTQLATLPAPTETLS